MTRANDISSFQKMQNLKNGKKFTTAKIIYTNLLIKLCNQIGELLQ